MGANAQTSVPLYVAAEVLTAANMNISAGTGVPVFATTVTRDAAFGGAGEKVLAEGQLAYIEASDVVQYYTGSAWATVGPSASALTLINRTAIVASSSQAFDNVFTSTYENYLILFDQKFGSSAGASLRFQYRYAGPTTQTASYFGGYVYVNPASSVVAGLGVVNNAASAQLCTWQAVSTAAGAATLYISGVAVSGTAKPSAIGGVSDNNSAFVASGGFVCDTARNYTGFILTASTGTFTGDVSVYGYAQS
jgi:hypothetical protein